MPENRTEIPANVLLPSLPQPIALRSAVCFGFDDWAFPFQEHLQTHLRLGRNAKMVIPPGEPGSHDEVLLYYGTVLRINDKFHAWYNGNYGPLQNTVNYERTNCCICYATSSDGETWEKPELGLVEFNGSRKNNIVQLDAPGLWSTCAVIFDEDEPDANRRYKMVYEAYYSRQIRFCVAFSPDGLRWTSSSKNPVGPFLEMSGLTKFRGRYYVNGQGGLTSHRPTVTRRLVTFVSEDFETGSPCGCSVLDRGPSIYGPATEDHAHQYEEIHLGAALWNRDNVIVGLYGMWHGHPTGDRSLTVIDIGLALSHDCLHFHEPIPGFRIIPAREQHERPVGLGPSLMQGQGMENVGDRTLYWYSLWRGTGGSGMRVINWHRDRLGCLKPFRKDGAMAISLPIHALNEQVTATVNAGGLGEHSQLRVALLDSAFKPLPGYTVEDAQPISANSFDAPLTWRGGSTLPKDQLVHMQVHFAGVRPEDAELYAIYLGQRA